MSFKDLLKSSILEQFETGISNAQVALALGFALLIALYLFFVYRFFMKKTLYNMNFSITIVGMTVVTTAIILTIQSNVVLSLGMVGALSIIRYRTAVKDPMDLFFLFWSVAGGIMCGAKQYGLAVVMTLVLTAVVFLLSHLPSLKAPYVMVINGKKEGLEDLVEEILNEYCGYYKIKSRSIIDDNEKMIIELKTAKEKDMMNKMSELKNVKVSLLTYEGDVMA